MSRRLVAAALAAAALAFPAGARAVTVIAGGNVINQTWTPAGSPYLLQGDVTVPAGAFLSIQPGVVVQAAAGDAQGSGRDAARVELTVLGTLTAAGTAGSPITFQSAAPGTPGGWYGLVVGGGSASVTLAGALVQDGVYGLTHDAAGAIHVLHDEIGLPLDVLGQMLREQAAFDIGRPAGREVDQHGDPLALVERLLGGGRRGCERNTKPQQDITHANRIHGQPRMS